jgi:hypothetical protein
MAGFQGPQLLIGDFNAILSPAEKIGGRIFGSSSHSEFQDFVHANGLIDLGFYGNPFTWNNNRHGSFNIRERLDRGLANLAWILLFPEASISHLPATSSDHNPILLSTAGNQTPLPKPFKFEEFWTRDLSSHSVIAEAWRLPVIGSAAFFLSSQDKGFKDCSKALEHSPFW